jgi:hypothetical protein
MTLSSPMKFSWKRVSKLAVAFAFRRLVYIPGEILFGCLPVESLWFEKDRVTQFLDDLILRGLCDTHDEWNIHIASMIRKDQQGVAG